MVTESRSVDACGSGRDRKETLQRPLRNFGYDRHVQYFDHNFNFIDLYKCHNVKLHTFVF